MKLLSLLLFIVSSSAASACYNVVTIDHQSGSQTFFLVEIADGLFSRARGLMFRENLPENSGMLFIYNEEVEVPFWMKNVSFPLDLVFANFNGHIVSIHRDAPPFDLTQIRSRSPFSSVLEINAGASKRAQIKLGDQMSWKTDCGSD